MQKRTGLGVDGLSGRAALAAENPPEELEVESVQTAWQGFEIVKGIEVACDAIQRVDSVEEVSRTLTRDLFHGNIGSGAGCDESLG